METVSDIQAIPILTCDVWEHAYYLKFQNRRNEFVESWWQLINWDNVVANYENFAKQGNPVELN
jgi:Fe-Mn family superoxide dismutase